MAKVREKDGVLRAKLLVKLGRTCFFVAQLNQPLVFDVRLRNQRQVSSPPSLP